MILDLDSTKLLATSIAALGVSAPAIAVGKIASSGLEAIGRNPEAVKDIKSNMILGIAFAEAIAIYALVIALIIKFV